MNRSPTGWGAFFERARVALLVADLGWTTLCLGGFMARTQVPMAILTGALVAVHLLDPVRGLRSHPGGWLFIPFLFYGALNVAWVTPVPWLGWADWLNWAQAVAVFWVVLNGVESAGCRRFICAFLIGLGFVAALLACYQHFADPSWLMLGRKQAPQFLGRSAGPFGIPNSLGVFMALLIPPVGALALRRARPAPERILASVALGALGIGFVLAISRGAWISLAAAMALKPLLSSDESPGRRLAAASSALAAAAAAGTILYFAFPAMHLRVNQLAQDLGERTRPILWRGAWRIFEAHPALGGGAGSFNTLFEAYRPEGYRDQPVYAHCDYLNTLADYGAVGFVLLFGAAGVVAWKCARARGLAAAALTGLLAFALHLFVDFHLKIPALAMIFAVISALVVQETWPAGANPARGPTSLYWPARLLAVAGAVLVIAATFVWIAPKHEAEAFRADAREKIDRLAAAGSDASKDGEGLGRIRAELSRAVAIDSSNAQAWSDLAYSDSLLALAHPGLTAEFGAQADRDADRALGLCQVIAEFWIRKGVGLDMQHRWVDGGGCFIRALQLAPYRTDVWYYQAYHLSLKSTEMGPAMAAAQYSLRLDPGFLFAEALRQQLAARLRLHP